MKSKIGYKVVRALYDNRYFSSSWGVGSPHSIQYFIGDYVRRKSRKNGPLAVFTNEYSARRFLRYNMPTFYKIFKCRYIPSASKGLWIKLNKFPNITRSIPLPPGTDFANAVKLIEEVKE